MLLAGRSQVETVWKQYLKAVSARLRDRLVHPSVATWPQVSAPAILRQIGSQELVAPPRGIVATPSVRIQPLAVFEATTSGSRARWWVLLFLDRVVVGEVPQETLAVDDGEPAVYGTKAVRFLCKKGIVVSDLVICCGEHRLTIAGPMMRAFAGFFGPVLKPLGLDAAALEIDDDT